MMRAIPPCQKCEYHSHDPLRGYHANRCSYPHALDMNMRITICKLDSLSCYDVRGTRDCKFKKRSKESVTS